MGAEPAGSPIEGKGAYILSQLYYYVAAVIGVGLLIGGAIGALFGLRELVLPRGFESTWGAIRAISTGLSFALPGAALLWTHLRQARKREGGPFTEAFWGSSLYYHLVALIALAFVLIGAIGILISSVDLIVNPCPDPLGPGEVFDCETRVLERIVDFAIFLVVAGPVYWWHLRQGRRLTGSAEPVPE